MRKSRPATVFFAVMTALVMVFACAAAEGSNYPTFRDALRFAQENKPQEMDLGTVKYTAKYLWQIRNALPEDAVRVTISRLSDSERSIRVEGML